MSSLNDELKRSISTGKVSLGSRSVLREVGLGRAKLVVIASNCPEDLRAEITKLANLSKIPVIRHPKNAVDLGILCGKPFIVSTMVIKDTGDSKIMSLVKPEDAEQD